MGALRPLRSRRPTEWKLRDFVAGLSFILLGCLLSAAVQMSRALVPSECFAPLTSETAGRYFVVKQYEGSLLRPSGRLPFKRTPSGVVSFSIIPRYVPGRMPAFSHLYSLYVASDHSIFRPRHACLTLLP